MIPYTWPHLHMNYDCFYFQLVLAVFLSPQILFLGLCVMCFGMCLCKWVCRPGNDVGCLFLIALHVTHSRWVLSLNLEVAILSRLADQWARIHLSLSPNIDTSTRSHAQLLCGCWGFQPSFSMDAGDFNPGPHVSTASSHITEPLLTLAFIFKNLQI